MTHTLYIGNDIITAEPAQIFCETDFVHCVEERMGKDARDLLISIIDQRNDAIKERDEANRNGGYDDGY